MAKEPPSPRWWRRALRVGLLSFTLAAVINWASDMTLSRVPAIIAMLLVLSLIVINIAFDVLGTSVTAAEQSPLNAMAAKKIKGSRQALWLARNADRVANFCNDVVGDVSGAVTGAAGTTVAMQITNMFHGGSLSSQLVGLGVIGMIAGLTVGGKAAGKSFAIEHATRVLTLAGRVIAGTEQLLGRSFTRGRTKRTSGK